MGIKLRIQKFHFINNHAYGDKFMLSREMFTNHSNRCKNNERKCSEHGNFLFRNKSASCAEQTFVYIQKDKFSLL
jgi:hypothetical protein